MAKGVLEQAEQALHGFKIVRLYYSSEEQRRFLPPEPVMISSLSGFAIIPPSFAGIGPQYFSDIEERLEFSLGKETFSQEFTKGGPGILVWGANAFQRKRQRLTYTEADALLLEGIMSVNCRRESRSRYDAWYCESFFAERIAGIGPEKGHAFSTDIAGEWQLRGYSDGQVTMHLPEYETKFPQYIRGKRIGFSMLVTGDGQMRFLRA